MHFTLAGGHSVAIMLAVAAAAIVLTGAFYRRVFGALKPPERRTLLALRSAAILIVVALLFQPVLSYPKTHVERPAIVFLLDTSASMSIADNAAGLTRLEPGPREADEMVRQAQGHVPPVAYRIC